MKLEPFEVTLEKYISPQEMKWIDLIKSYHNVIYSLTVLQKMIVELESQENPVLFFFNAKWESTRLLKSISFQLKNFCSDVVILDQLSKKTMQELYSGQPFLKEWLTKYQVLAMISEYIFINEIRQYLEHYAWGPTNYTLQGASSDNPKLLVCLSTQELTNNTRKWKPGSREIFRLNPSGIPLTPLINTVDVCIKEFWNWSLQKYVTELKPSENFVQRQNNKQNAISTPMKKAILKEIQRIVEAYER